MYCLRRKLKKRKDDLQNEGKISRKNIIKAYRPGRFGKATLEFNRRPSYDKKPDR